MCTRSTSFAVVAVFCVQVHFSLAADPIEEIAEYAVKEFDVVAKSVEKFAASEIIRIRTLARTLQDHTAVTCEIKERTKPKVFINQQGDLNYNDTISVYSIFATKQHFQYRFLKVSEVHRSGLRNYPFKAVLEFEVTRFQRLVKIEIDQPLIPQPGWRLATQAEQQGKEIFIGLVAYEDDDYFPDEGEIHYPLPAGPPPRINPKNYPKIVRGVMEDIQASLRKLKPTETKEKHVRTAYYSLNDKAWTWAISQE